MQIEGFDRAEAQEENTQLSNPANNLTQCGKGSLNFKINQGLKHFIIIFTAIESRPFILVLNLIFWKLFMTSVLFICLSLYFALVISASNVMWTKCIGSPIYIGNNMGHSPYWSPTQLNTSVNVVDQGCLNWNGIITTMDQ